MSEEISTKGNTEDEKNGAAGIAASKALEKVLVWIMYTAIVGSAVYFATKLQQIEATIAQHHGQGWAELKNIVQTSQIQSEVSGAKEDLSIQITSAQRNLTQILEKQEREIKNLSFRLRSLELWTSQGDLIMTERDRRQYKGHALFTDNGSLEHLCIVNYAHPNGRVFKINDRVKIINADSHKEETTICTISGNSHDTSEPTVLLTLNKATSTTLNFSKEIGRINIFASLAELPEERRWKNLADFRKKPYFQEIEFNDPFAKLPATAAGGKL